MQFVWPIKADYRIVYLDDAYQQTIIGRTSRDYVWVMARTAQISDQDYSALVSRVSALGYDIELLQKAVHTVSKPVSLAEAPTLRKLNTRPSQGENLSERFCIKGDTAIF